MDLGNLHVVLKGLDGNQGHIKSLSDNDINKLKKALSDLEQALVDIGNLKQNIETNDFALKSGDNSFTGQNTFSITPTITAPQTLDSIGENDAVKGAVLKELSTDVGDLVDKALQVQWKDQPPQENELNEKVFIICPQLDLLV